MRIDETDIQKAVVKRLKDNGFNVVADDVKEGFDRPAIFVGTYPSEITRLCGDMERVTDVVSMIYHPKAETRVQCMFGANRIRNLFMYSTLDVSDRSFTVEGIKNIEEELTMSQYTELKKEISEIKATVDKINSKMIYNYVDSNMPDWAKPTIRKMMSKGYLKGDDEGKLGLTDEQLRMFVINDRAGVYGD